MLKDLSDHIILFLKELFGSKDFILVFLLLVLGGFLAFARPIFQETDAGKIAADFLRAIWPIALFFILFPIMAGTWLHIRQEQFKRSIKWAILEIKIPRINERSPKAMEQVFAAIHSLRNAPGDIREKYWDGEVTRWYSFEMVSFGGEIRFFVRTYAKQKNLIEAAFFSHYPDIELVEVDDYMDMFPKTLPEMYESDMDIWGTEMVLRKEDMYPIKTYPHFESPEEEKQLDPISAFLEVLGKVKETETVGIQILLAPAGPDWAARWLPQLQKLKEPKTVQVPVLDEKGGRATRAMPVPRTPGEENILKAIDNNISKPAFATLIRFIYISPKVTFHEGFARRGIAGAFNQYSALNMNSIGQNYSMSTRTMFWYWPHIFPKWRLEYRKQRILWNYLHREVPPETFMGRLLTSYVMNPNFASKRFMLNIEGAATLFHPPMAVVLTAPHIRRIESRKTGPPAGLPIYGEEKEIEKYL